MEVVFNQDSIPGDCPGTYTLLRNWTSIDCSGNEATHEQVVEVSDTEQPELIGLVCPEDATIFLDENCEVDISPEALGMPSVSAIDNCSEAAVVIEFEECNRPTVWRGLQFYTDLLHLCSGCMWIGFGSCDVQSVHSGAGYFVANVYKCS